MPRVTPNKPPAKPTEIDMIKFDPSNPLDCLEDLDELSSVGHLRTHIDNCKDVVVNNVNTDAEMFDATKPCLTCKPSGHSFDNCPALNCAVHLQKHCIKWKTFLVNESGREAESLQQKEINQLEAECAEAKQSKHNFTGETVDFLLEAATEAISHILEFTMGNCEHQQFGHKPCGCCLTSCNQHC